VRDPIDVIKPWTIKAVATEARDMAIMMARKENLTVGQWLERVIREAASDQVSNKSALVDAVQLAPLIPSMPQWLRAALFRRVAGQLGIEPPHRPRKALTHEQ
jgi:hypothetical protein